MKSLFVAIVLLMVFPLNAVASDWFNIGTTQSGELCYIDLESIQTRDDYVSLWSKTTYKQGPMRQSEFHWVMNCAEGTGSLQAARQYGENGQMLFDQKYPDYSFSPIPPKSMGDVYFRFACQWNTAARENMTSAQLIKRIHPTPGKDN